MEEVIEAGMGWVEGLGEMCEDVLGGMSLNDCIKGPSECQMCRVSSCTISIPHHHLRYKKTGGTDGPAAILC